MSEHRFEQLVAEAIDDLPEWVHQHLENVDVVVEAAPPLGDPNLLGLYEGVPLTERGSDYGWTLPDRITLFRSTIVDESGASEDDLKRVVADTVVHEIAHFFGIGDERLHELGRD